MRKLLVSDYDGTFYRNQKEMESNIKKANKYINDGNIFVIATGRSFTQIKREIDKYNIRYSYLICNDGALIYNHINKPLYRKDIPNEVIKKIIPIVERNKDGILKWFVETGTVKTQDIDQIANGFVVRAKSREISQQILDEILENVKEVDGYLSIRYVNIIDKKVSKANAIKELNKQLHIAEKNITVVGDEINDISMLKAYDGYIIESGNAEIRKEGYKQISSVGKLIDILREENK